MAEMFKSGGISIIECLLRIFNRCMYIVPIYKGKGDRAECANYRGISILSIPRKIYRRVLISSDRKYERIGSRGARGI